MRCIHVGFLSWDCGEDCVVSCLRYSLVIHSLRYLAHQYFKDVDHDEWWLIFLRKLALASWLQVAAIETVVSGPTSSLSVHRVRISVASRNEFHRQRSR